MEDLLTRLVEWLSKQGDIFYRHLFVDGTKVKANTNKYSLFVRKLFRKMRCAHNLQVAIESEYIIGIDISSERSDVGTLEPFF